MPTDPRPKRNARQKMDGLVLLKSIPRASVALVLFDPQYRAVLDGLKFGNEGKRQGRRAALAQMSDETIARFIHEIARVLRPSSHCALWIDKFTLASGHYKRWFKSTPHLFTVDLIAWDKLRFGMGRRSRGATEYLLIIQKEPTRAKGVWTDHRIPDCWPEASDRATHPHAKPYQLTDRLIRATTKRGDLVVDPCAGSYVVLEACRRSGREFLGCDLI